MSIINFAEVKIKKLKQMEYDFREIEKKWQKYWDENKTFKVDIDPSKPKYYVLDMFPYPSGAGLHVGHPLGYIASDILSRYMRLKGYNVLHPMGYDAFGLPAEQYAIEHGVHPAVSTERNIQNYRRQLKLIGLSYDWSREVRTCDPEYYKWTQWAFLQMYKHWYNKKTDKAEPIEELVKEFEKNGNLKVDAACNPKTPKFTAEEWNSWDERKKQEILMNYRIAYKSKAKVNWCPELGTVLSNDEVKDGLSIRGGYPVYQLELDQWLLRTTAYAERLLKGLEQIDWPENVKEIQRNWIGRSEGAEVYFKIADSDKKILIFTTRPDTIYGATFMVLAPEHELVKEIVKPEFKEQVEQYLEYVKRRSERERIAEVNKVTGVFTGAYAINPFTNHQIPIWISEYVLGHYGTGAIMAVPAHDSRDYAFAKHFGLPIIQVIEGADITQESYDDKHGKMINSGILNGLDVQEAIQKIIEEIENRGLGRRKVNYRMRDAIFSRQRYWGEPFPIYYKDGIPYPLDESELPLELPDMDDFRPTKDGKPPLAKLDSWKTKEGYPLETSTMPGFAGSSAYYIRFMDPHNNEALVSKEAISYWKDVDFYLGGVEHATGHLIYSRFWNKFLKDIGVVIEEEPFKKLVNQGMIQGRSNFVYRIKGTNTFVSKNLKDKYDTIPIHVNVNIVNPQDDSLDIEKFMESEVLRMVDSKDKIKEVKFILEKEVVDQDGNKTYIEADISDPEARYICGWEIEKMSKSKYNVVNPDEIIEKYGADTFRLYEMFLGPITQSKPWNTQGIEGMHRFLKRFWSLYFDEDGKFAVVDEEPTEEELKILNKTIDKVERDIKNISFNTAISTMMVAVNSLSNLKTKKRKILEPLLILISPFAPHLSEELWRMLGHEGSIAYAEFPKVDKKYLVENTVKYVVTENGKKRFEIELGADMDKQAVEKAVLGHEKTQKLLKGKSLIKVIVVPKKLVNLVVKKQK